MPTTILKKKHSQVGKNATMQILRRFKDCMVEMGDYARVAANKLTEELSQPDLKQNFKLITGELAEELLELLGQQVTDMTLRRLLHVAIILAKHSFTQLTNYEGQSNITESWLICVYWVGSFGFKLNTHIE